MVCVGAHRSPYNQCTAVKFLVHHGVADEASKKHQHSACAGVCSLFVFVLWLCKKICVSVSFSCRWQDVIFDDVAIADYHVVHRYPCGV